MSDYLNNINEKRQVRAQERAQVLHLVHQRCPCHVATDRQEARQGLLAVLLANLQHVITQLEECQYCHIMLVAGNLKGTVDLPFIKYITRVHFDNKGNPLNALTSDTSSRVMLGLHTKDAIRCQQKSGVDTKTICPFWPLSVGNHELANNHIWVHRCLGLICGQCFLVELMCEGMVAHAKEFHLFNLKRDAIGV